MDNYLDKKTLEVLKSLVAKYDEDLCRFGVDVDSLPDDIKIKLDLCINAQMVTGLHDLDELFLKEFYLEKCKEKVDNMLAKSKIENEISQLKAQIVKETEEYKILKKFISQGTAPEEHETKMKASELKTKIQKLTAQKQQFKFPENLDIEELIRKVEILQAREADAKK